MEEAKLIFDVAEASKELSEGFGSYFFVLLESTIAIFIISSGYGFWKKNKPIATAFTLFGFFLLIIALCSLFIDPITAEYQALIDGGKYHQVEGRISELSTKSLIAGDPVAIFKVGSTEFEYGRGSENYLVNGDDLEEGALVRVWFKSNTILRIYHLVLSTKVVKENE